MQSTRENAEVRLQWLFEWHLIGFATLVIVTKGCSTLVL